MRLLVRRSRLHAAEAALEEMTERRASLRRKYEALWIDHLGRCQCHDAWDQCPCSETGTHSETCGCCEWCP